MVSVCISVSEMSSQVHTRRWSVCVRCVRCVIFMLMVLHTCARIRWEWESIINRSWALCISSWGDNRRYYELIQSRNRQEPRLITRVCILMEEFLSSLRRKPSIHIWLLTLKYHNRAKQIAELLFIYHVTVFNNIFIYIYIHHGLYERSIYIIRYILIPRYALK